ncbi:DEAD/DEAH box helicase [Candidatus Fermentibacteria bacterium]|nr:DEAD/DEAH box helicase [Candidatus Fermentibacteria bacterium]
MKVQTDAPQVHKPPSAPHPRQDGGKGVFESLIPGLRRSVAEEGYALPTPIQEQCIPLILEGRDILGTAQTGTGKTAAFALPILQMLSGRPRSSGRGAPRVLVLAPTRELAAQIDDSLRAYGRHLAIRHTVVFGGVNQARQVTALDRGVDILTATPGRLLDLVEQGYIHLDRVEHLVLDEVDRMLDMGFIPDVRRVLALLPSRRQTLFFSATMPRCMEDLARSIVRDPVRVAVSPGVPVVEMIDQKVAFVEKKNKDALLIHLLSDPGVTKVLVFTQMKHTANKLVKKLSVHGIQATAIHGNKSQSVRTKSLEEFRRGGIRVLVATDLAARGLDVDEITHVINYDLPVEAETYVHRIGRTARAGAGGDAISICCMEDLEQLRAIDRLLGAPVPVLDGHPFHWEEALRLRAPVQAPFGRNVVRTRRTQTASRRRPSPPHRR